MISKYQSDHIVRYAKLERQNRLGEFLYFWQTLGILYP
jgi:hypothetical protein